jgi:hypothetical protein
MTTALDRVIPAPALVEIDEIDVAVPPARAWELIRHGDLADAPLVHALFAVRTLPDRIAGRAGAPQMLRIDEMRSSPQHPGFQVLADDGHSEVVVGAIGKVWHLQIPFVHVKDADAFRTFSEPGFVKVAWTIRVAPRGESASRISIELRVDATDADAWGKFRRYYALIGPASHLIRRSLLSSLASKLGTPDTSEEQRALAGDELLSDARAQITQAVTIAAPPEKIWPWLVQMGCRRGGFYSIDALDNDGVRSARELHADLQRLRVGDILPATPDGDDGFEVLDIQPERLLVLGGLYDADAKRQRPFASARPEHFWQATWSFVLEPLDAATTRLHVRARASFPTSGRFHAEWIRPVHRLMQASQLKHLVARVEGTLPRDDWRDVVEGFAGVAVMAAGFLTPFQRGERSHWGLDPELANRTYPGDELVANPRWGWTHGIEIDAPVDEVWPWIEQLGADRGGFYSYQWLENVAGCALRNAETTHPEWTVSEGDAFSLHPKGPVLRVERVERGKYFLVHGPAEGEARPAGKSWAEVTWLFYLEPLGPHRSRFISRYRCATSDDLATRLSLGPAIVEPIGFAMDRRMLLGVKSRVEAAAVKKPARNVRRRRTADAH